MFCIDSFYGISMNNLLPYRGLIDAKIRTSDKDLPVIKEILLEFLVVGVPVGKTADFTFIYTF